MRTPTEVVKLVIDSAYYEPGLTPYLCFQLYPMAEKDHITYQEAQSTKDAIMHWLSPDVTLYARLHSKGQKFTPDNVLAGWEEFYAFRQSLDA